MTRRQPDPRAWPFHCDACSRELRDDAVHHLLITGAIVCGYCPLPPDRADIVTTGTGGDIRRALPAVPVRADLPHHRLGLLAVQRINTGGPNLATRRALNPPGRATPHPEPTRQPTTPGATTTPPAIGRRWCDYCTTRTTHQPAHPGHCRCSICGLTRPDTTSRPTVTPSPRPASRPR